jgi:hypothetical protein
MLDHAREAIILTKGKSLEDLASDRVLCLAKKGYKVMTIRTRAIAPARQSGQLPRITPKTEDVHALFELCESLA